MTKKQAQQFNYMRSQLIKISKGYMTPNQIRRNCERLKEFGPDYEETLEMSYENMQNEARFAVKGVKAAPTV